MKSTDIIKASANSLNIYSFTAEALERLIEAVKAEQPCQTCEALARTVMLDQTSHDTSPPASKPWVGLTDEELSKLVSCTKWRSDESMHTYAVRACRAVEAAHGIKENV